MAKATNLGLGLACFAVMVAMTGAAQFKVGGDNGWSVSGANAESYNTWAERTRFQMGDSLVFVYPKDKDSVLLVEPGDYNACNTSSYVRKFDDGNTVFTFDRSGVFFFISGVEANCRANEKLIVMVLASRNGTGGAPPPSSSSPPPASSTPPPSSPPPTTSSAPPATPPSPPPAPAPKAPTSAPPPASAPTTPSTPPPSSPPAPSSLSPAPTGSPPAPPSANAPSAGGTNSTATSPPPAGSNHRNGAGLTAAAGLVSSAGACIIGYAMLSL